MRKLVTHFHTSGKLLGGGGSLRAARGYEICVRKLVTHFHTSGKLLGGGVV